MDNIYNGIATYFNPQHIDAIAQADISPETIAYAIDAPIDNVKTALFTPKFSTANAGSGVELSYDNLSRLAAVTGSLGSLLCENKEPDETAIDDSVNAQIRHLHNVNKLSIEQLAALIGVSADTIYDFAENPATVPYADKYRFARLVTLLFMVLNCDPPRPVNMDDFAETRTLLNGLTGEEMGQAMAAVNKPIERSV